MNPAFHSALLGTLLLLIWMHAKNMFSHIPCCITVEIASWNVHCTLSCTDCRENQLTCEKSLDSRKCTFLEQRVIWTDAASACRRQIWQIVCGRRTVSGIPTFSWHCQGVAGVLSEEAQSDLFSPGRYCPTCQHPSEQCRTQCKRLPNVSSDFTSVISAFKLSKLHCEPSVKCSLVAGVLVAQSSFKPWCRNQLGGRLAHTLLCVSFTVMISQKLVLTFSFFYDTLQCLLSLIHTMACH